MLYAGVDIGSTTTKCILLDENGEETGMYYLAGPYCPEESLMEVCLPSFEREPVGTAVSKDELYRKGAVEAHGTCTVHVDAPIVDPWDPSTWDPTNPWYSTDPEDPSGSQNPDEGGWGSGPSQDIAQDIAQDIRDFFGW